MDCARLASYLRSRFPMNALNEIIRKVPTHDKPRRPLIPRRGWGGWRKWEVKPRETETETETKKKIKSVVIHYIPVESDRAIRPLHQT